MCTAATYKTKDFYMGRTLDYEFSYGDEVTVTPRNYPINFRFMGVRNNHFAMIGMSLMIILYIMKHLTKKGLAWPVLTSLAMRLTTNRT